MFLDLKPTLTPKKFILIFLGGIYYYIRHNQLIFI